MENINPDSPKIREESFQFNPEIGSAAKRVEFNGKKYIVRVTRVESAEEAESALEKVTVKTLAALAQMYDVGGGAQAVRIREGKAFKTKREGGEKEIGKMSEGIFSRREKKVKEKLALHKADPEKKERWEKKQTLLQFAYQLLGIPMPESKKFRNFKQHFAKLLAGANDPVKTFKKKMAEIKKSGGHFSILERYQKWYGSIASFDEKGEVLIDEKAMKKLEVEPKKAEKIIKAIYKFLNQELDKVREEKAGQMEGKLMQSGIRPRRGAIRETMLNAETEDKTLTALRVYKKLNDSLQSGKSADETAKTWVTNRMLLNNFKESDREAQLETIYYGAKKLEMVAKVADDEETSQNIKALLLAFDKLKEDDRALGG